MNHLLLLLSILAAATAQRSSYAGSSPIGIPKVASRFANTSTAATTTASGTNLANRVGTSDPSTTLRIPTDARGDADLIKRVETWPRENQPFWYINADHVEKQRHPDGIVKTGNVPTSSSGQASSAQVPVNNQNQSGQSGVPSPTTVNDRGSFDAPQGASGGAQNSFSVFRDNQQKTYVYDPVSDSWVVRRS